MKNPVVTYGVTLSAVVAAAILRWTLDPLLGNLAPFATFYVAVVIGAWLGGLRPALLATVTSLMIASWFFIPPRYSFLVTTGPYLVVMILNFMVCLVIASFGEAMHRAERRQRAGEAEAHRLLALNQTIMENMGEGLYAVDAEGRVTYMNPEAERLFGWTCAELMGRKMHEMTHYKHPDGSPFPIEDCAGFQVLHRGVVLSDYEDSFIRKDGSFFPVSYCTSPLRTEGKTVGLVVVFRDMTRHRQAEQALRQQEERLRLAVSVARVGTWDRDLKTGEAVWSEHQFRILGYEPTPTLAPPEGWADRLHPDDRERVQREIDKARLNHTDYRAQCRIIRADNGAEVWVDAKGQYLYDEQGEAARLIGAMWDITGRVRLEESLRDADRRKDEFLAILAHELRNPLAPLRNGLQVLRLSGQSDARIEETRTIMERQLGQMVHLIDDLLDVSRISRGKLELRKDRVELATAINHAIETSRPLVEAAAHTLTVNLPAEPVVVDGDETRLAQIFANLLNNAAKYTPAGGNIELTMARQGSDVVVTVKDSGLGIPPAMLPNIFEMFTQVDRSLGRSQGGLGIGLTLVRRLVELHGGSVEAHSDGENLGSEFIVRLPMMPHDEAKHLISTVATSAPAVVSSRRILIVDDNQDAAFSLSMVLKLMGNETRIAHDGLQGVELAEAYRPEIVLLDIGLPTMNGHEVCRHLRKQPWGRDMVVIALTGWGQAEDKQRSHEAGFDHHLVKPVAPDALEALIAAC